MYQVRPLHPLNESPICPADQIQYYTHGHLVSCGQTCISFFIIVGKCCHICTSELVIKYDCQIIVIWPVWCGNKIVGDLSVLYFPAVAVWTQAGFMISLMENCFSFLFNIQEKINKMKSGTSNALAENNRKQCTVLPYD